jgi:PQQ-like domain
LNLDVAGRCFSSMMSGMVRPGLAIAILAACGTRSEAPPTTGSAPAPHVAPDAPPEAPRPVKHAPHGAAIALVAVTETGDAAITADTQHDLRLWPSLDGKHEPVVVRGASPRQLAIARHATGFVVALLDQAGGAEVLDLDREGGLRTRSHLPADPAFVQLVALPTGVLARRSDHTVVLVDLAGHPRGEVTALPAEQIVTLATRRGAVLAGIGDRDGTDISRLRWLEAGAALAWGATLTLPEPLDAAIALAPSGRRLAGVTAKRDRAVILELAPAPAILQAIPISEVLPGIGVGFTDEESVVVPDGSILRSTGAVPQGLRGSVGTAARLVAVDGGIVVANDAGLERRALTAGGLGDSYYLGYRDHALGTLRATAAHLAHEYDGRVYWLDRDLVATRALDASFADNGQVIVLDDRYVLQVIHVFPQEMGGPQYGSRLVLMDAVTGTAQSLGTWPGSDPVYEPSTHVLALVGDKVTTRLRLDLEKPEATPLPSLKTQELTRVTLFDPAVANGICAIAVDPVVSSNPSRSGMRVETFVEPPPDTKQVRPTNSKLYTNGSPITADRAGMVYVAEGASIAIYARGVKQRAFPIEPSWGGGQDPGYVGVDPAGTVLTLIDPMTVVAIDLATGAVRWRVHAWHPRRTLFASDGKSVAVLVEGGLLSLDAATGQQVARACGWGFGLTRHSPRTSLLGTPVVCAAE